MLILQAFFKISGINMVIGPVRRNNNLSKGCNWFIMYLNDAFSRIQIFLIQNKKRTPLLFTLLSPLFQHKVTLTLNLRLTEDFSSPILAHNGSASQGTIASFLARHLRLQLCPESHDFTETCFRKFLRIQQSQVDFFPAVPGRR